MEEKNFQPSIQPIIQETLNRCVKKSLSTVEEEEEEEEEGKLEESSQQYIYRFDDPLVQECAYVQVLNKKIIVQFPIKPDHTTTFKSMHHVQLFLNSQLIFHSGWLPVSTLQDHAKFKTIFHQLWHEYTILTQYKYCPSSSFVPWMHSELVTIFNKPSYYLSCLENNNITCIELETKLTNLPSSQSDPVHVQFYFGPYLVLCSETQLQNLDVDTLQFVLSFILLKCMN
jgi:hypothetical protein